MLADRRWPCCRYFHYQKGNTAISVVCRPALQRTGSVPSSSLNFSILFLASSQEGGEGCSVPLTKSNCSNCLSTSTQFLLLCSPDQRGPLIEKYKSFPANGDLGISVGDETKQRSERVYWRVDQQIVVLHRNRRLMTHSPVMPDCSKLCGSYSRATQAHSLYF